MESRGIIFIDSNYWIYLFDKTTLEHPYVKKHFENIFEENELAVNVIVMVEVMHYLLKHLSAPLAREKWELFSSMDLIIGNLNYGMLNNIFSEFNTHLHTSIGGRDATILAFLKSNDIHKICTHDKSFRHIPYLEVIDPIPKRIKK